jgi:hypothetical protein
MNDPAVQVAMFILIICAFAMLGITLKVTGILESVNRSMTKAVDLARKIKR